MEALIKIVSFQSRGKAYYLKPFSTSGFIIYIWLIIKSYKS